MLTTPSEQFDYQDIVRALAREIARTPSRQSRIDMIAALYLAGVHADGFYPEPVASGWPAS